MSLSAPHDIYVRHIDKDGRSCIQQHRVWDGERFMAARQAEARKEGGKAGAEQLSREQFLAQKK